MRLLVLMLASSLLAHGVAGCQRAACLTGCDSAYLPDAQLPVHLDCPTESYLVEHEPTVPPTTVDDTDREKRYLSLREAIALALEYGTTGVQTNGFPGIGTDQTRYLSNLSQEGVLGRDNNSVDNLVSFTGANVVGSDSIRVLAVDPAIVATEIEHSLSRFDAHWTTSLAWSPYDKNVSEFFGSPTESNDTPVPSFSTSLLKPLPTGAVAGVTFHSDYAFFNTSGTSAPGPHAYLPSASFQFEQPLLQGFGVAINQIRDDHPNSILTPFTDLLRSAEGILVTRLRFDQERAEFERNLSYMLLNVEVAYWNLYGTYANFYARTQAMQQGLEVWRLTKVRFDAGQAGMEDVAQARLQYERFRILRTASLAEVLEAERELRALLGLPVADRFRLVPCDTPSVAPFSADWNAALSEALEQRPELALARKQIKVNELKLIAEKDRLRPDLRAFGTYDVNALGNRFSSGITNGAVPEIVGKGLYDWSVGVRLDIPIGYREASAETRAARLTLARSYALLKDQEQKTERFLALQYRHLAEFQDQIQMHRAAREAATTQLEIRRRQYIEGQGQLDRLLLAELEWAEILAAEFQAVTAYNNALVGFQFAKGTVLGYEQVTITEGPLPACAVCRAVDHERARTQQLVEHERSCAGSGVAAQTLLDTDAPSLPALLERDGKSNDPLAAPAEENPRP